MFVGWGLVRVVSSGGLAGFWGVRVPLRLINGHFGTPSDQGSRTAPKLFKICVRNQHLITSAPNRLRDEYRPNSWSLALTQSRSGR